MRCPHCHSEVIVKNGSNGVGAPKFRCKACSRQFVERPKNPRVTDAEKDLTTGGSWRRSPSRASRGWWASPSPGSRATSTRNCGASRGGSRPPPRPT
ncbi:transposase, partial [Methylomagnum sp.]